MTENEKLDLIIFEMQGLKEDVQGLKKDVQYLKEDMQNVKEDVQVLKSDMQNVKEDVRNLKSDMRCVKKNLNSLRCQVVKSTTELRDMDEMILSEVGRVHIFLERHKADLTAHTA